MGLRYVLCKTSGITGPVNRETAKRYCPRVPARVILVLNIGAEKLNLWKGEKMNRFFHAAVLASVALLCFSGGCRKNTGGDNGPVTTAPAFTLTAHDGSKVSLSDYEDRIVVLEWFNFECPFVKYHYGEAATMKGLASRYAEKGVVWLAINSTSHTTAQQDREFAEKNELKYPILDDRDGRVGRAYGAVTTPHMFVIDKRGRIVYRGAIDNAPMGKTEGAVLNHVDSALDELIAGQRVSVPETKPYGCNVKYPKGSRGP
jgi:peroxiredoxin